MKSFLVLHIFLFALICSSNAGNTFTSNNTGNWDNSAIWTQAVAAEDDDDGIPDADDIVNILGAHHITIPAGYAAEALTLTINSNSASGGGNFTFADAASSLTVYGNTVVNAYSGSPGGGASFFTMSMNGATFTVTGNLTVTSKDNGSWNMNQYIVTGGGGTIDVNGNLTLTNNNGAIAKIDMNYANSMLFVGGTFSIGSLDNGAGTNGTITYDGAGSQTLLSAITYYKLATKGGGTKTLNGNIQVNDELIMDNSTPVNLNTNTLTLGTAVGTPGTLTHTSGLMYNGTFKRWISATSAAIGGIASNQLGYFPMGTSMSHNRPLWIAYSADLTSGGTISILHNPTYPPGAIAASHVDGSWAGGTTLQGVSNSTWVVSSANGFAFNGSTGILRFGGEWLGAAALTDIDASLTITVVSTYAAATNVNTTIEVNRTGIATADLANTWRIGTKNLVVSPLPIELLSFTSSCNKADNKIILEWITATEINNDYFTVERSDDEVNFIPLATLDGVGNSSEKKIYRFEDLSLDEHSTLYYRLKQTDFNGEYSYSKIIASSCPENNQPTLSVSSEEMAIRIKVENASGKNYVLNMYDGLGNKRYSMHAIINSENNEYVVSKKNLSSGFYVVVCTFADQNIIRKIIAY